MPTAELLLEIGAVIFGLGVLGRLARMIRFSPIPLYLLAGVAFGRGGVLPLATSEEFLSIGAEIGVILLLLLLGLEYSADELLGNLRRNSPAGLLDVALGAGPGVVVGVLLGWSPVAIVAMAGITYVTSSGITAKLLGDLGRLGNRETPVVLSLLVLEDLSMAVYLPILTALIAGVGLLSSAGSVLIAVGLLLAVLIIATRFGGLISRLVSTPDDEVLLLLVFGVALLVAGITQQLHVSSAVGAFLVGIALSGQVAESARSLLSPLRDLFAAVFFVFFGFRTDPSAIPPALAVAVPLAAVSVVTKMGTGWWAARRAGIARLGRVRTASIIVSRGEFSIVIAGLAAATQPELRGFAAAYILLMATVGPPIARWTPPVVRRILRRTGRLPPPQRQGAPPTPPTASDERIVEGGTSTPAAAPERRQGG